MNKLLPVLLIGAMVALGFVIKIALSPADDVSIYSNNGEPPVAGDLARRASGIAGDRDDPSETIRTLTQMQQQTLDMAEKDRLANQQMRESVNQRIAEGVSSTLQTEVSNLKQMFEKESAEVTARYESQIEVLQQQVDSAKKAAEEAAVKARDSINRASKPPANQIAMLETQPKTINDFGFDNLALNTQTSASIRDNSAYTSLKPLSASTSIVSEGQEGLLQGVKDPLNGNNVVNQAIGHVNQSDAVRSHPNTPRNNSQVGRPVSGGGRLGGGAGRTTPGEPMYTIIDGATLYSNITMTALMGKVPVGRAVTDPFRFKLITGGENLAASKMYLAKPIENVIWTGYTTGNRELSCVSGYIDTVSLVYSDGTISTTSTKREGSRDTNETSYLGYISDKWGKPCIRGQLYDNGESYLKNRAGLSALAAAAEGISIAQTETESSSDGGDKTTITGDVAQYSAGLALSV